MRENNQEPRHKQQGMNRKQINATRCKHREIKPTGGINEKLRGIPSVDIFFKSKDGKSLSDEFGAGIAKFTFKKVLNKIRKGIKTDNIPLPSSAELAELTKNNLIRLTQPAGRHAINATGILLHTGLGRAPYPQNGVDSLSIFNGYSLLQTDLESGKRSLREEHIEELLCELTGCEAATILNNNAEATMLILNELAKDKEVIISRGQLVEIGGSFRMPDVMDQSGAIMKEIGTTNKTHIKDYNNALSDNTGVLLHVHTSNYRVRGFSSTPSVKDLCEFRKKHAPNIPVVDDLGSGGLVHLSQFGLPNEPLIKESIAAGVDLVCFSGDKLICGPQAGIICGKKTLVDKIRKNSFARMFRVGKMTLSVLESTLIHFVNNTYKEEIPFYKMLDRTIESLSKDADEILKNLPTTEDYIVSVKDDVAYIGSGSVPDLGIPDKVLSIEPLHIDVAKLAKLLRNNIPSVFCRIKNNTLLFNMRTLLNNDLNLLKEALNKILQ